MQPERDEIFDRKEGYFRETENDQVMEKVDVEGNIPGFPCRKSTP